MTIERGAKLGPYEILSHVGSGGMGSVYRARDSRLGRDVAIKVLAGHLSSSPDIRQRFEREARTVAQLNHPNICTLFDIGRENATDYLVFEFVDGQTLADRLTAGPMPVAEILIVGGQIVDALTRAHRAGVVHRDIKPGNIMLTASGVKLLDFGLARSSLALVDTSPSAATRDVRLTTQGAILGTLPYMSPEQIQGQDTDARSDIFALGCVFFEMATGRRLFDQTNNALILSAILQGSPENLHLLAHAVPPPVEKIIRRCLERESSKRYADAAELAADLTHIREWVRDEAIPNLRRIIDRIQSLDEGPETWEAYNFACEIEMLAPGDPQLERLWPEFSRLVNITSDPPGADVSIRYYSSPDGAWLPIGQTPLEVSRFPRGFTQIRLELSGYQPQKDIIWSVQASISGATDAKNMLWHYRLVEVNSIPPEMEMIPGGEFALFMPGLDHLVPEPTAAFLIDRHPVTNRAFKAFVDAGGYRDEKYWRHPFATKDKTLTVREALALFTDVVGQPGPAAWEMGEYPHGEDDFPVTGISWFEAAAYAAWADKSLPTLFHWNRVAFTVASSQIIPMSNFSQRGPHAVGTGKSMNRFGVYDLAGNVREWTWNECNRAGQRFILGGGWNDVEYAFADAYAQLAFDRSRTNGFRCIREVEADPNYANLHRQIELPFRDFLSETPVSDAVFQFFLGQFRYDKLPLKAVVESSEETALGTLQFITFAAAYGGERMMAYLYLPAKGKLPLQTVVIFPGSLALYTSNVVEADWKRIDFLIKSGRAVLYPILKGTYHRLDGMKTDYPEETTWYKDHVIMWGKDISRSIDYLETREDIDASRLAYYGLSWGGAMGGIMPAVEKRFKAVVLYVAGMNFQRAFPGVDQINYVSRVTQPTLMLNGERDFFFPAETSQKPMFELLGAPAEHKRRLTYPLGHSVPRAEMVKETLGWLERWLGSA